VGYNSVADNTGLSSFEFDLTAVQGHRSWCQ